MNVVFSATAERHLADLPPSIARRIVRKMQWFAEQKDPLAFAKRLVNPSFGSYRFRVGDYRVLVDVVGGSIRVLLVLAVKHRKDVYRALG